MCNMANQNDFHFARSKEISNKLSSMSTVSFSPTAEFLDEDVAQLQAKGHKVERIELLSLVEGTRRTNDLIIGVKDPRSADASALTMSKMP